MKASFLILFFLIACAHNPPKRIKPNSALIETPAVGETVEIEIGETVVRKGILHQYDGIRIEEPIIVGDGVIMIKYRIPPQVLVNTREDKVYKYFVAQEAIADSWSQKPYRTLAGIRSDKKNNEVSVFVEDYSRTRNLNKELANTLKLKIQESIVPFKAMDLPSEIRELSYTGKSGKIVNFLYRETDRSGESKEQALKYDLSESSTIGVRGLRIKILSASNTLLKYKVLSHFD